MGKPVRIILVFICFICLLTSGCSKPKKNPTAFIASDIAALKHVIILPPGYEHAREAYNHYVNSPYINLIYEDGLIQQHQELVKILRKNKVEVLNIVDLLEDALTNARETKELEKALKEMFPDTFPQIQDKMDRISSATILGRVKEFYYHYDDDGSLSPLIPRSPWFFYTRDFAAATPKGIILTNSKVNSRKYEHIIGRFMFRYADALKDCPIVFDAEKEGVRCEGGDIIVKDENTILMGIHNFSEAAAAQKIAQNLKMDVYGVAMPLFEDFSGANIEIMHLDTVFNLVDREKALTVPYLFEKQYTQNNPILRIFNSVNTGLKAKQEKEKDELDFPNFLDKAIKNIPEVGWLTHYKAGTGDAVELGVKLVDFLREQDYTIIWVGGDRDDLCEDVYILERVLYELSMQAANVVQIEPGKVLSYMHNKYTNQALEKNGIKVISFESKYLADCLGGPHCLTMPLERRFK